MKAANASRTSNGAAATAAKEPGPRPRREPSGPGRFRRQRHAGRRHHARRTDEAHGKRQEAWAGVGPPGRR